MDDLVSRIISVSMDLYFYYIPITFPVTGGRVTNFAFTLLGFARRKYNQPGEEEGRHLFSPGVVDQFPPSCLSACRHRIGENSTNSSHNKRRARVCAARDARQFVFTEDSKAVYFFYVFSASVHIRHRDQRVEKKQSRNNGVPLSERDAAPTYDGVFISYAKRWSIAHRGGEGEGGGLG